MYNLRYTCLHYHNYPINTSARCSRALIGRSLAPSANGRRAESKTAFGWAGPPGMGGNKFLCSDHKLPAVSAAHYLHDS
ncbi:hypothetical protein E2C01_045878 [Portunus trituberculatus]|uniref:Uncharacterized protein n=1 Tax=Portunus trituberculatus TaxID=210409 RepID=A0A5B7G4B0_PORTR|nr:hypothetical protein [Portunus trituberculatus]